MGFIRYKPKYKNVERLSRLAEELKKKGEFKEEVIDTPKQHNSNS